MSGLEDRLAEIDRRLRSIQADLVPDRELSPLGSPGPAEPIAAPEPGPAEPIAAPERGPEPASVPPHPGARSGPLEQVLERARASEQERHLGELALQVRSLGEVASSLEQLQSTMAAVLEDYHLALSRRAGATLSAGPFHDPGAVHAFQRALAALVEVQEVVLRGYEGADRAIIDVRLGAPNP